MEYTIRENKKSWSVKYDLGKVRATVNVSKELCGSVDELEDYLKKNKIIGELSHAED